MQLSQNHEIHLYPILSFYPEISTLFLNTCFGCVGCRVSVASSYLCVSARAAVGEAIFTWMVMTVFKKNANHKNRWAAGLSLPTHEIHRRFFRILTVSPVLLFLWSRIQPQITCCHNSLVFFKLKQSLCLFLYFMIWKLLKGICHIFWRLSVILGFSWYFFMAIFRLHILRITQS